MAKKTSKRKHQIAPDESKAERFVRVVSPRVSKAVKAIDVIGYCAGSSYEYNTQQVEKITQALFASVNKLVDTFAKKTPAQEEFKF